MDDRRKRIDELERVKQEGRASLDTLLENFGENLYSRSKDMQVDFEDIILYNVHLKEIAESNTAIGKVEEKNRRFRELEETIEQKELEEKERSKELEGIHKRLGKALLENKVYEDFTSLFREQADALTSKLESLESRIKELENKDGGNVFSWIGKSAQGLVLRSFLSKAQESQELLYLNVGERYSDREASGEEEEVKGLREEIAKIRAVSHNAMDELMVLRDEKRMISAGFGIDGNPQKQIQNLKNHIGQVREELRSLYKNFGAQACGVMDSEIAPERKYFIDTIVTAEDAEVIGRAVKLNQSIFDYDRGISKLKASLAIDEENAKIEKYRKSIEEKKNRIIEFEKNIADLQESVQESETKIQELQKQL
jgi:chromosome segregation ATPase